MLTWLGLIFGCDNSACKGSTHFDLFTILLEIYFKGNFQEGQQRLTRASVLSFCLLVLGSKYTSLSSGFWFANLGCTLKTCFLLCSFLSVLNQFRTILEFVLEPWQYLSWGCVPSLPLLTLSSVSIGHNNAIQFLCLISFYDFLFLPGWLFDQMKSKDVAGVLQEVGEADSRACTSSQV